MSLQTSTITKVSGEAGGSVSGLSLTLNSSLVMGFNCAPLAMGKSNTFVGYGAGQFTKTGSFNTVFGYAAGQNNSGNDNTYVGFLTAQNAGGASANLFVGANTGLTCSLGGNNVLLGSRADLRNGTDTGCVAVGFQARAGTANSVTIGASARTYGRQSLALGYGVNVVGDGHFNVSDRMRGYFARGADASNDTYVVQIDANQVKVPGALAICQPGSNAHAQWQLYLGATSCNASGVPFADLFLQSANNAVTRFTDEFWPSIFDFTGQHRCIPAAGTPGVFPGAVVVATGRYRDLTGGSNVGMDESIPEVALCDTEADPRVFGVVSAVEDPTAAFREYRLGTMGFRTAACDARVVVNAAGEGAVWVCDAGGPLENGDLITSSRVPGLGMRQSTGVVMNTTVAKITCDCDFASNVPGPVEAVAVEHNDGRVVRRVLVGCTYKA